MQDSAEINVQFSDPDIAKVDSSLEVKAIKKGTTELLISVTKGEKTVQTSLYVRIRS